MNNMFSDYYYMMNFLMVSFSFMLFLLFLSFFSVYQKSDKEKISSYECGFYPFDDASMKYEVRFYIIAMLYIIFDIELMFLLPWALAFMWMNLNGLVIGFFFIVILLLGFFFELTMDIFNWQKWSN